MKVLCLGAGGVGGYFGARLLEAGCDLTFLLRPGRAEQVKRTGLKLESPLGDWHGEPRTLLPGTTDQSFDLIILSCKAYDLDAALEAIAPFVERKTSILPLLNGVVHVERMTERFPDADLWGGVAHLGVTQGTSGEIVHLNTLNNLLFGPVRPSEDSDSKAAEFESVFSASVVAAQASTSILQDMWDKLVFLGTLAGITCVMRADIGTILRTEDGKESILSLLAECQRIAELEGYPTSEVVLETYRDQLTDPASTSTASMLRDIWAETPTESDHILGDLCIRASKHGEQIPLLSLCRSHMSAYEESRAKQG